MAKQQGFTDRFETGLALDALRGDKSVQDITVSINGARPRSARGGLSEYHVKYGQFGTC